MIPHCLVGTNRRHSSKDILQLVGANSDVVDERGRNMLHIAVLTNSNTVLKKALSLGLPHVPDNDGNTPLMLAIAHKHFNQCEEILKAAFKVANITHINKKGESILHLFAQTELNSDSERKEFVKLVNQCLPYFGSEKSLNVDGESATQQAITRQNSIILDLFDKHGIRQNVLDSPKNEKLPSATKVPSIELGLAVDSSAELRKSIKRPNSARRSSDRKRNSNRLRHTVSTQFDCENIDKLLRHSSSDKLTSEFVMRVGSFALEMQDSLVELCERDPFVSYTDVSQAEEDKVDSIVIIMTSNKLPVVDHLGSEIDTLIGAHTCDEIDRVIKRECLGELPLNFPLLLSVHGVIVIITCIMRHNTPAPVSDCVYNGVYSSLLYLRTHNIKQMSKQKFRTKKFIRKCCILLPSFQYTAFRPYGDQEPDFSAAWQMLFACNEYYRRLNSEDSEVDLVNASRTLQSGPTTTKTETINDLLQSGTLMERGIKSSDEENSLIAIIEAGGPTTAEAMRVLIHHMSQDNPRAQHEDRVRLCNKVLHSVPCMTKIYPMIEQGTVTLHREILFSSLEMGDRVGTGGTSFVSKAKFHEQNVAVKVFHSCCDLVELRREIALMSLLYHPNLITIIGAGLAKNQTEHNFIVTEFINKGSLYDLLHSPNFELSWNRKLRIAVQISNAMNYLHSCNIIHRDLKSMNILITNEYTVKLTDYGSSRLVDRDCEMTQNVGTAAWIAPEVLESGNYSTKADVFSFGMVMYEIATSSLPFEDLKSFQIPQRVLKGVRPTFPKTIPKSYRKLAKQCWQMSPPKRPTFEKITPALLNIQRKI